MNTEPGNYVVVYDQVPIALEENTQVVVSYAVVDVPAWLVIQADNDGLPGEILGMAPLNLGLNRNVTVQIDNTQIMDVLHAALYLDGGELGEFEYPGGDDIPLQRNRRVVEIPFLLLPVP